ncbi:MAG TPA: hypothetical protein VEI53_07400, partial [Ktedonobacteraceae bacterium]|nr:hypothetical protein [Ktedonobacteraceae bacterium]
MKSQFVKIRIQQSKSSNSEQQVNVSNGRSGTGTPPSIPFKQLQAGNTVSGQVAHATSNGQQPHWQAQSSSALNSNGFSSWGSIAEQNTLKQQAVFGTTAGHAKQNNSAQAQMLAYGQMPASPYQSGITPFAVINASSEAWQASLPSSTYYAGIQPASAFNGSTSQPQTLLKPMPRSTPFSSMPTNYQGAGGYPPEYSSLPPGPGMPSKRPKKRRFPIWARIAVSVLLLLVIVAGGIAGYYYYNFSSPVSHIVGQQVTRLKGDEDPNAIRNGADILS